MSLGAAVKGQTTSRNLSGLCKCSTASCRTNSKTKCAGKFAGVTRASKWRTCQRKSWTASALCATPPLSHSLPPFPHFFFADARLCKGAIWRGRSKMRLLRSSLQSRFRCPVAACAGPPLPWLSRYPILGHPINNHCHLLTTRTWWRLFRMLTLETQLLEMGGGNLAAQSAKTPCARGGTNPKRPFKSLNCGGALGGHCPLFQHLLLGLP